MADLSDPVLTYIIQKAQASTWITKIILFGSRARGNSHDRSDYDIAVIIDSNFDKEWAAWALETTENVPSLCGIDLILMDKSLSKDLRQVIDKEGSIIYERKKDRK